MSSQFLLHNGGLCCIIIYGKCQQLDGDPTAEGPPRTRPPAAFCYPERQIKYVTQATHTKEQANNGGAGGIYGSMEGAIPRL